MTLENTWQLLSLDGYLMLLEITNHNPVRYSNVTAGLFGWWLDPLRKSGFSGVGATTRRRQRAAPTRPLASFRSKWPAPRPHLKSRRPPAGADLQGVPTSPYLP